MSNIKYNKFLESLKDHWARFKLACSLPDHIMYMIYARVAGELTCHCCVFWRGVLLGIVFQIVITVLAFLIGIKS